MIKRITLHLVLFTGVLFFFLPLGSSAQEDVPEPLFMNFSIQPLYVPIYHGRDPFKPVMTLGTVPNISISELDYHGVMTIGNSQVALFTWKGNQAIEYMLKYRKLYDDDEKPMDGVVGDISDSEVVLIQGAVKMVYPRK